MLANANRRSWRPSDIFLICTTQFTKRNPARSVQISFSFSLLFYEEITAISKYPRCMAASYCQLGNCRWIALKWNFAWELPTLSAKFLSGFIVFCSNRNFLDILRTFYSPCLIITIIGFINSDGNRVFQETQSILINKRTI